MIKIAVCIKQVPAISEGAIDRETGMLIRSSLEAVSNQGDVVALEVGVKMKEKLGGSVTVFTMGPQSARQVLKDACASGADEGVLISDQAFAGADVLATSYTLAQALKRNGTFDCILCGSHTTDGDTGCVGAAMAQWLNLPFLSGVTAITELTDTGLTACCERERNRLFIQVEYPCVVSVERTAEVPRMPSFKGRIQASGKRFPQVTLSMMKDTEKQHYGIMGSATMVKRVYPPSRTRHQDVKVCSGSEAAEYILSAISKEAAL